MAEFSLQGNRPAGPSPESQLRFGRLLSEVSHKLSQGQDSETIFEFLFDTLRVLIPYDRIGVALVQGEGEQREICSKWVRSRLPTSHLTGGYCAPLAGTSLQKILETGEPRIINDLERYALEHPESESTKLVLEDGVRSSLTCPLRANGKFIGIVFFSSARPGTYAGEHAQTYLEIADELSLIIEHERLRISSASKSRNMRMVLHDLKNPLGVIQGFLDMSLDMDWYKDLDPEAKEVISILRRNSGYMQELLGELSELAQLEAKTPRIEMRHTVLDTFLSEVAIRGRDLADPKEITFRLTTEAGLPETVPMDASGIRRVLDNLISNAVKYSNRGTQVDVVVERKEDRLIFKISDQGQGIPTEEVDKLFNEFSKTSVRPTEGEPSTGLGLAIAKRIVEQHHGEISVMTDFGRGSTFSFWIPLRTTISH